MTKRLDWFGLSPISTCRVTDSFHTYKQQLTVEFDAVCGELGRDCKTTETETEGSLPCWGWGKEAMLSGLQTFTHFISGGRTAEGGSGVISVQMAVASFAERKN